MYKYRLVTPGPVSVPERVRRAMAGELIHHRQPEFRAVLREVREKLKQVFQTRQEVLVLASSGTGAMEATVANLLSPGERAVVVRGGKFGERWAELCEAFGVRPVCVDVEWGRAVQPAEVRAAFQAAPDARALLVQASETSTGVFHPVRELAEVVHEKPGRMILVDGISAVGVHDLPMDAWDLDGVVSGSQKSWMLPPGLAFIALSPLAQAALERSTQPRYYFDLRKELEGQPRDQTAYTPAVSLILGLREALSLLLEEGLPNVFARHEKLARVVRAAVEALGLTLFAPDSPSFACTAVRVPADLDGVALVQRLIDVYGVHIAGGQGKVAGKIFRIGHMGDVDGFDMLTVVAALEMVLLDLGYPAKLGEGTRTATQLLRELSLGKE
jgi:aspartate aminotransferase-like enzyme